MSDATTGITSAHVLLNAAEPLHQFETIHGQSRETDGVVLG